MADDLVERYEMYAEIDGDIAYISAEEHPFGDWVRYSDYAALRAQLDEARKRAFEEAAQFAEECDIAMGMIVGGPDGASIARRQIAAAIRRRGDRE